MKIIIIGAIFSLYCFTGLSQNHRINCTIFIDGKLPNGSWMYNEYFVSIDSTGNEIKIDYKYVIGEIQLTPENANLIYALEPENTLTIYFTFKKYNGETYKYFGNIRAGWLNYEYLILRITNLNSKKGEFYFGYNMPGLIKPFIKAEYNMFEEY
jgi:hypothetical protein